MKKSEDFLEGTKRFLKKRFRRFSYWFTDKEHPRSKLNNNVFFYDRLKILGLLLVYLILHANVDKLNNLAIPFIKIGGLILLVMLFFIVRKAWHLILNLKYAIRGLNNGFKAILVILIILLLFFAFINQEIVVDNISTKLNETNFSKLNPIQLNSTFIDFKNILPNVNTCPQINVSMEDNSYRGLNIKGKNYDGWTIKGDATCRKGTKEGENLNLYYCGGYTSGFFGIGSVNAYVEKTIISESGNIGKTHKYVIWNKYDEEKKFIETKCLGDPDEFDEKQAKAFMRELERWG